MSFPRYPSYKPSGVEWLGEVPEHWQVKPLKRVADIQTGLAKGKEVEPEGSVEVPFLRVANVQDGFLDLENVHTITISESSLNRYLLRPGDVLMNEGGDFDKLGRGCIWDGTINPCIHQNHVFAVRPHSIRHSWLNVYTSSAQANSYFISRSKQSTNLASISSSNLMDLLVPIAPDSETEEILDFLNRETAKIDALIAEQQRLIELLQEKRQAVISHAVTKGLNPDAPMKDSGVEWLGEVPEHWEVRPLKHLANVQTGMAKGKDLEGIETVDIPYLRVANVQDGYLDLDEVHLLSVPVTSIDRFLLKEGDVLMNEGGDFDKLGRGCIWSGEIDPCVHQNHVFAVRPHSVSGEWLNVYTTSNAANSYFISRAKQSTNLASISSTNLMGLPVPLPPPEEARGILVRLNALVKETEDLKISATQATDLLQERRTALISATVTGQIDVRGLVADGCTT
jgi:type I restriction enzyme S subunit